MLKLYNRNSGFNGLNGYLKYQKTLILFLIGIVLFSISLEYGFAKKTESNPQVRNIILFIGDGMGIGQITLARLALVGADGQLNIDRFPYTGFLKTHSANDIVTDSAAAGTALATGQKTNNGMIGVSSTGQSIKTVLELAEELGKATGLITTVSIVHATPAAFGSHQASRSAYPEIANQIIDKNIEVLLGGGRIFFIPATESGSKRKDTRDLLQEARGNGYSVISTESQLSHETSKRILGIFADDAFIGNAQEPSLANMVSKAIERLARNKQGFFLMAEGGQIDWKAHANQPDGVIQEMRDFDAAVGRALEFAQSRKDTLVIVTADHETGGLSVLTDKENRFRSGWNTTGHTGNMVAVFAYGPSAERFIGVLDNTDIGKIISAIIK